MSLMSLGKTSLRLASRAHIASATPSCTWSQNLPRSSRLLSLHQQKTQNRWIASARRPVTRESTRAVSQQQRRTMASNGSPVEGLRLQNPAIFVCDIQEKFRNAIHEFDNMVTTAHKLVSYANALSIPVYTTTQTSAKLGPTVDSLASILPSQSYDKTRFSMYIPDIAARLPANSSVALVGIESHICITQTALDLRDAGHKVYIMADGVSSCNKGEITIALDRLRAEQGITVTTSESWMYECLGDASHPNFKGLFNIVKASMPDTKKVMSMI